MFIRQQQFEDDIKYPWCGIALWVIAAILLIGVLFISLVFWWA